MIELKDKIGKENTDKNAPNDAKEFVQEFFSLRKGLLNYISPELVNLLADDLGLTGLDFIGGGATGTVKVINKSPKLVGLVSLEVRDTITKAIKTWKEQLKQRIDNAFKVTKPGKDGMPYLTDEGINARQYADAFDAHEFGPFNVRQLTKENYNKEIMESFLGKTPKGIGSKTSTKQLKKEIDEVYGEGFSDQKNIFNRKAPESYTTFFNATTDTLVDARNQLLTTGKDGLVDYNLLAMSTLEDVVIKPVIKKHPSVLKNNSLKTFLTKQLDETIETDPFMALLNDTYNIQYGKLKTTYGLFKRPQDSYGIAPVIVNPLGINNKEETSDPYYGATKDDSFVDIMTGLRASTKDLINKAKDKDNITVGQLLSNYIPKDKVEETAKKLARFTAVPEIGLTKSLADNLPLQNGRKMTSVLAGLVRYTTDSNTYDKLYSPIFNNSKLVNQLSHNALQYLPNDTDADTLPEIPLHELISPEESRALEAFASPVPAIDKAIKNTNFFVDQKEKPKPAPQHKVDAVGEFVKQMGGNKK